MSALPSPSSVRPREKADALGDWVQDKAIEHELEVLRAENAYLRQQLARHLGGGAAQTNQTLPVPLESALSTGEKDSPTQRHYQTLLEALASVFSIGVFHVDGGGMLTHVDGSIQRMFGLDAEAFAGLGWLPRVHPHDREQVERSWLENATRNARVELEFRLLRPDGGQTYLQVRNAPLLDPSGQLQGHIGFVQDISSLRELQAGAPMQEVLNRQIMDSSPACTLVLDLQGRVLQTTDHGSEWFEAEDLESLRGNDWTQWWKGDAKALAQQAIADALSGKSARFVAQGDTSLGTPRWWDTVVAPISDAQGQSAKLLVVSRDVTDERQHNEQIRQLNSELESRVRERTEALAATNDRLRLALSASQDLYNHAPCGYHSVNAQGFFVEINQTELEWLGYTREELVGKRRFRDLIQADQVPWIKERLRRLVAGEKLDAAEVQMLRRDGSGFVGLLNSTSVTDENGVFLRTNNTLVDITERKAAESALEAQRRFLQTITDSIPVQLAFFDSSLICQFANASYARWKGGDPRKLVGLHLQEIARPQDYETVIDKLGAALKGEAQHFEGERQLPDGQQFYASIEYIPYRHEGQVRGLVVQMLDISQRKASEDLVQTTNLQLAKALQEARALYNQAPCGYHSVDARGVYVDMNDTELQWLGYSREEVVGKLGFQHFCSAQTNDMLEQRLQRLQRDETLEPLEYQMHRKDGSTLDVLISSTAVRDPQGQYLHSNTTVADITQRKRAEAALRENQRFLQTVTEHFPGVVAYLDAILCIRFANEELARFFGADPKAVLGRHVSECLSVDVWRETQPWLQSALDGQKQQREGWRLLLDGSSVYVRETFVPDISDGLVQGVIMQVIDITDSKRVEQRVSQLNDELEAMVRERSLELLEAEQRFRLMADNLREYSIFFLDDKGLVTDWTDSAFRMHGHSPSEMLGQHYAKSIAADHPQDALQFAEQTLRIAASRGQHELHSWSTRADGSRYWVHSLMIALRDDSGELRGFCKISRDMTDAKRLDDLMRNINEELENRVVERTEQLLAANKDLESFSYTVSHDLRSPLRHISSFVSLLEEHLAERHDETTLRYLGTIGNSARHMSQLIDGLLAFSRLGRSAVNLTPVDFNMLVDAVVSQFSLDTEGRVVDWVIAPDLPVVQGDALLLREVWANLLNNAFKYTRRRERARIEIGWSVDPAVGYNFYVGDNGVGFDTKYAQKLFGVFQRLHRASDFEGTGIGLALTRRILERHGGSIWAESQPNVGSVFHFSLPFEASIASETSPDSMPSALEP